MDNELDEEYLLDSNDIHEEIDLESALQAAAGDIDEDEAGAEEQGGEGPAEDIIDDSIQGFFEHREPVYSVAIHPVESSMVVSGGGLTFWLIHNLGDDKPYVWNMQTGEKVFDLEKHGDSVVSVAFSADGQFIATGGMDGRVIISQASTGIMVLSLDGPDEVTFILWHPRGNVLLAGALNGTVWMWNIPSGACMNVFTGHGSAATHGSFTPDGKTLITSSDDGTLIVWDPKSGSIVTRFSNDIGRFHQGGITTFAIHHESNVVATGSQDHASVLVHIGTGRIIGALRAHTGSIESVDFCSAMPLLATASVDGTIRIWDTVTMRLRHTLQHNDAVTKIQFAKNTTHLFSSSSDKTIRAWDARSGECLKIWQGHQDTILDFALGQHGRLVSGGDDGVALVFSTAGFQ